jgi:rSAM/selenodomain-associated transferase 1
MREIGIAIFAKAPIAGFAKSRLVPCLGADGAAELQRQFIWRTVRTAIGSAVGPVSLWCAPDVNHELFTSLEAAYRVTLHNQPVADLGRRMLSAFELITRMHPLLVVGTDCPALTCSHLIECADALHHGADAVFLPTEDGGYALIGLNKPEQSLFENIPWSTSSVMVETRLRARRAGLAISEPAILWDVDTPSDYARALAAGLIGERVVSGQHD